MFTIWNIVIRTRDFEFGDFSKLFLGVGIF